MEEHSSIRSVLPPPLTSPILVAEVREAPHVAKTNDWAGNRQNKLYLVIPLAPFLHLLLGGGHQVLGLPGAFGEAFGSVSYRTDMERNRRSWLALDVAQKAVVSPCTQYQWRCSSRCNNGYNQFKFGLKPSLNQEKKQLKHWNHSGFFILCEMTIISYLSSQRQSVLCV